MKVLRIAGQLADPASPAWAGAEQVSVALGPVAHAALPNAYIREAWAGRPYGTTADASLAAASDGERLFVRIEWADDPAPNGEFEDAAAAIFPTGEGGPLQTLGTQAEPLGAWYWQHGRPAPLQLTSRGPGVVRKDADGAVAASENLASGRWSIVLSGPAPAGSTRIGVAVWNGSNEERGGLAAVSREWLPLEIA